MEAESPKVTIGSISAEELGEEVGGVPLADDLIELEVAGTQSFLHPQLSDC